MNDRTELNGRRPFVWLGQDPTKDTNRLTDAVAEATVMELFNVNGSLFQLVPCEGGRGRLVAVNKDVMRDIITRHIAGVRLLNHGSTAAPIWKVELYSFDFPLVADTSKQPDQQVLLNLITALAGQVAKGPQEPRRLSPQQQREIHARVKMNEPKDRIADAYGVDIDTIKALAKAD
jgi:hypothetical protein